MTLFKSIVFLLRVLPPMALNQIAGFIPAFLLRKIALYLLYKGRFGCIIEPNRINIIHNINTININGKEKRYAGDNDSRFLRNSRQPATQ